MKLREVKAITLKDQVEVLEDNLAVATLLQTLDSDGDPDNDGIVISSNILAELKAKNITALPTNQDEVAVIYEVIKNVEGYQGSLKTEEEAQAHLDSGSSGASAFDLKALLAGKTFFVHKGDADDYLTKIIYNADATSISIVTIEGPNSGESRTRDTVIDNNSITIGGHTSNFIEDTVDYLLIGDVRYYRQKTKAVEYYGAYSGG